MTAQAELLALALEGLGGAPPDPGTVHVVGPTIDGASVGVRGAVVLAAADVVAVAGPTQAPGLALVGDDADIVGVRLPDPDWLVDRSRRGAVVVRYVDAAPLHQVAGLTAELEALAASGVRWGVDPRVSLADRGRVPDVYWRWENELPLAGRRVLVPRSPGQAASLAMHVRSLGGSPVRAPTILIQPGEVPELRLRLRELAAGRFRAVAFTSPNGVAAVADALPAEFDARVFAAVELVAAVGSGTAAALRERLGLRPDLVPATATTEALGAAFPPGDGAAVLLPRADLASPVLPDRLRTRGWEPVGVDAYRTVRPDALPADVADLLGRGAIDLIPLASSSTARNVAALAGERVRSAALVSIGPVTTATCRELGLEVAAEADPHTLAGLVDALVAAVGNASSQGPDRV